MNINHTLTYLNMPPNKQYEFQIDDYIVKIQIHSNEYQLDASQLFEMAIRNNKKRSFLFVSKVLGKHLAVTPQFALLASELLVQKYAASVYGLKSSELADLVAQFHAQQPIYQMRPKIILPEAVAVIGFAETATALGHMVFNRLDNARFVHTTREVVPGYRDPIVFEEEHSHATTHFLYVEDKFFDNCQTIVLVDDELSTGKTAINFIREMFYKWNVTKFVILSYLDWRSDEDIARMNQVEAELGIFIQVISLIGGRIEVGDVSPSYPSDSLPTAGSDCEVFYHFLSAFEPIYPQLEGTGEAEIQMKDAGLRTPVIAPFIQETGRFGLNRTQTAQIDQHISSEASRLQVCRKSSTTICIGTGEFMYLPLRIAAEMGNNIVYQSSTRSPIYPLVRDDYPIQNRIVYSSPEHPDVENFLYNIDQSGCNEAFVFFEREMNQQQLAPMLAKLRGYFEFIHIVYFSNNR